jgi:hypothetical protein
VKAAVTRCRNTRDEKENAKSQDDGIGEFQRLPHPSAFQTRPGFGWLDTPRTEYRISAAISVSYQTESLGGFLSQLASKKPKTAISLLYKGNINNFW